MLLRLCRMCKAYYSRVHDIKQLHRQQKADIIQNVVNVDKRVHIIW